MSEWLSDLRNNPVPGWIERLSADLPDFPLADALSNSVFVPASGLDRTPVHYLSGLSHSFIFVDSHYQVSKSGTGKGRFKGYDIIGDKLLRRDELIPKGWSLRDPVRTVYHQPKGSGWELGGEEPVARWVVYEKQPGADIGESAVDRFSLVYLRADGVKAYQALYLDNHVPANVVCLMQPGFPIREDTFLNETIIDFETDAIPQYLFCAFNDYNGEKSFWPSSYQRKIGCFQHPYRFNGMLFDRLHCLWSK